MFQLDRVLLKLYLKPADMARQAVCLPLVVIGFLTIISFTLILDSSISALLCFPEWNGLPIMSFP
jgi:hypothetical protein